LPRYCCWRYSPLLLLLLVHCYHHRDDYYYHYHYHYDYDYDVVVSEVLNDYIRRFATAAAAAPITNLFVVRSFYFLQRLLMLLQPDLSYYLNLMMLLLLSLAVKWFLSSLRMLLLVAAVTFSIDLSLFAYFLHFLRQVFPVLHSKRHCFQQLNLMMVPH